MKAKAITNFASQFGVEVAINPELIVEKSGRYFLVNAPLKPFVAKEYYYIGVYLGKAKEGKFFPSFNLLNMLAKNEASRIVVDGKAAWLFICGRDVLGKSVVRFYGSGNKNTNVLVLNEFAECLGFGRIVANLSSLGAQNSIAVKHVSDIGDFLRRER
jgi:ribosome biogenesis protein Nip4